MATYTWVATGSSGDWKNTSSWNLGIVPTATDVAVFTDLTTRSTYTINVGAGENQAASELLFTTTGAAHEATLSISGTLTTGTLAYDANQAGLVEINAGGVFDVTTAITDPGSKTDTFEISGKGVGGRMELGSLSVGAGVPAVFAFDNADATGGVANTGVIQFTGFATGDKTTQVISNVAHGDEFIFIGANFAGDTVSLNTTSNILTVTGKSGTALTMDNVFLQAGAKNQFTIVGTDIIQAVCYARGTMIRTPDGERPVEELRPGRQVITLVDGREVPRTVTWLGRRRIYLAAHPKPETVAPVRMLRDAFADGVPHRDLVVSPDHAIFVDGTLICVRQLVNGTTIRQEFDWTAVDYYHVELDRHAILLAEGLPAESYIDTGNSGFFANSAAPLVLHPDLTDESGHPTREAGSCAPFVWDEASVRPVWQRLAERAATIGHPVPPHETTVEPALRLIAKGRTVKPVYGDDHLVIFSLPRGAREVRLLSRAQPPTMARPWLEDRRRLGVRVARIVLRGVSQVLEVPVDHPDIAKGWWAVERDGQAMARWTDGDATVPLPAINGNSLLEIHLAGTMSYVVESAEESRAQRSAA